MLTDEEKRAELRDRQRIWSLWLDEHYGPGSEGLDLALGADREELAQRLAHAVGETPEKDLSGRWKRKD